MKTPALNVLVVDDSRIMQQKIATLLADLGHLAIGFAETGAQAVALYAEKMPDVVTMDITMPDMDGIEATRKIRGQFPNAAIVMVTSHGQEQMVLQALDAGAMGYVLKPVAKDRLEYILGKVAQRI